MEHLWSQAGATGGNRWRMRRARKRLKQADPQPSATDGNGPRPHGKEGVDGFESVRGLCKSAARRRFLVQTECSSSCVRWVWSLGFSFRARNAGY